MSTIKLISINNDNYKGDFPLWFTPIQFGIIPINERHNSYCKELAKQFKKQKIRIRENSFYYYRW